jgi:HEAT repeat protein
MDRRIRQMLVLTSVALLTALPRQARARIGGGLDLARLCEQSDLIVVGQARTVRDAGTATPTYQGHVYAGRLMAVELGVERALKGTPDSDVVSFTYTITDFGEAGVKADQFGVFFLRAGEGGYEVTDPDYPSVISVPGAPSASGTVLDKVVAEVAYVLDFPGESTALRLQAVLALATSMPNPSARATLRRAALNQPVNVRLAAMGDLLARNDIALLPEAQRLLLSRDPAIDQNIKDGTAGAIGFGVKDPRAIPFLIPLLRSPNANVRRGAAAALRLTHSPEAVRGLVAALDDPDPDTQYSAVIGLAEITHAESEWAPANGTFMEDPARYLNYWREWAKNNP